MRTRIIVFPGSNCDHDAYYSVKNILGERDTEFVWHKESSIGNDVDVVILPGGFSYGDYLRTGAIPRFSPIMHAVRAFADHGGPVLGVRNGLQTLLWGGLPAGAIARTRQVTTQCEHVDSRVQHPDTP